MRPCADIQMAYFAVPHLSIRQPDKMIRSLDQRIRKLAQQLVIGRLASKRDRIVGRFCAKSPSIEDGQNKRMFA